MFGVATDPGPLASLSTEGEVTLLLSLMREAVAWTSGEPLSAILIPA
jgi:hypothetical protein